MKDKLDELIEAEDYLADDGQETGVATDSLHELVVWPSQCSCGHLYLERYSLR